jgi:hypothetical protein
LNPTIKFPGLLSAFIILAIILSFSSLPTSEKKTQEIISKTNLYNLRFPQEKIYLHLDRPSYWANDDIWFKAYVKDSPINECNLYVELINASGSVVYKNIAWVQNGLAYGDFHLEDTLSTGIYQIRAYTNWMRNFDEVWFFRKDLVIWNVLDQVITGESKDLVPRDVDFQFFPEGGTFISGMKNKVAFKATDNQGKGIDFEGLIIDDSKNIIIGIKSDYKGIGSFVFEPEKGKKYSAEISIAGNINKRVSLPKPTDEGFILAVNVLDSAKIGIQIIEKFLDSDKVQETEYLIMGQSGGEVCYHKNVVTNEELTNIDIQKQALPGGIIKFTLFDLNLFPLCERLVYNNQVNIVPLVVMAEKSNYLPREEVKIGLVALSNEREPCFSNLSMSVYNTTTQIKAEEYPNNIYTQFLLNSELKGNIENPAYYFKDDSLSTLLALDNLMLTHGYREFEWKEILEDEFPEITFQPEPSIEIKGKVVSSSLDRPVVNGKVTMMTLKSLLSIHEEETDSLGQFLFPNLYFYDTIYVSLNAINKRGKRTTSIEIDHSSSTSPESNYLPYAYEYNQREQVQTLTYLNETNNDLLNRKWTLSDTILLDDVYVITRKKEKEDGHPRSYLKADYVFDMDKQDDVLGNIFESIEGRFPGVRFDNIEVAFFARGKPVKIYMDGMEDTNGIVGTLPSQMFDKVEYIRSGVSVGINYDGGILFFYAKRGGQFVSAPPEAIGMAGTRIIGYSLSRKFYSPKYESPEQLEKTDDYRNTIYWNPVLRTDSTGFAQVSFYNSNEIGDIQVVVEGVTSDGKLCRGLTSYQVTF